MILIYDPSSGHMRSEVKGRVDTADTIMITRQEAIPVDQKNLSWLLFKLQTGSQQRHAMCEDH